MPAFVSMSHPGGSTNVLSDPMVSGIFASKDACPGRTAYLAGCIATGELHPLIGDAIDVGSFVKGRALIGKVHRTEIIHQNK